MAYGDEVERDPQVRERAGIAGHLCLAGGEGMPGFVVPELEGDDGGGSSTGEPEPAAGFVGADLQIQKQLERSGQRRRGGCVSLRQPQRKRVEQNIHHPRRVGTGRRCTRGLGGSQHAARALQVAGPDRCDECLEVRLACQVGVKRLEAAGRVEEQPSRVAASLLLQRNLPAQVLHLGCPQSVKRASLDRDQQPECLVESAGIAFRFGACEQALRTVSGFRRQDRRSLEERGRRGEAPARMRSAGRALELLGDVLVGPRGGLGPVPGAAIGIDLRISDIRQCAVHRMPFLGRRRPVGRRAHQRMTKPYAGAELEQAGLGCRGRSLSRDSEPLGCSPHQHRFSDGIGSRELQEAPRLGW